MNRRYFFSQLASGLIAAAAPALFLPKLIKPTWSTVPVSDLIVADMAVGEDYTVIQWWYSPTFVGDIERFHELVTGSVGIPSNLMPPEGGKIVYECKVPRFLFQERAITV